MIIKENKMKLIFRVLALSPLIVIANTASAVEMCRGELPHVPPLPMSKGAMVSISGHAISTGEGMHQRVSDKQALKSYRVEPYQRPVLVGKGLCHKGPGAFNTSTVKM